jgi:hypothetical protein
MQPLVAPDRAKVDLIYEQRVSTISTFGTPQHYVFRGNGVYDPDQTGTGGQPTGYDQWSALYDKVVVMDSEIDISFFSLDDDTSENETTELGLLPTPESTFAVTDVQENAALPYGHFVVASFGNARPLNNHLHGKMSSNKIFGVTPQTIRSERNYSSSTSATPNQQWFWNVAFEPANESSNVTLVMYVRIRYTCEFWSRKTLSPSLLGYGLSLVSTMSKLEASHREMLKASIDALLLGLTSGKEPPEVCVPLP